MYDHHMSGHMELASTRMMQKYEKGGVSPDVCKFLPRSKYDDHARRAMIFLSLGMVFGIVAKLHCLSQEAKNVISFTGGRTFIFFASYVVRTAFPSTYCTCSRRMQPLCLVVPMASVSHQSLRGAASAKVSQGDTV